MQKDFILKSFFILHLPALIISKLKLLAVRHTM